MSTADPRRPDTRPGFTRSARLTLACMALTVVLAACQTAPPSPAATVARAQPGAAFAALAEQLLLQGLDRAPEAAIAAGRYQHADRVTLPTAEARAADAAFAQAGLDALAAHDPATLPPAQRIEHLLLSNRFRSTLWQLQVFREWSWNPARHNVAGPIGQLLNTPYAPLEQRLRSVSARLAQVPAFYAAARSSIEDPTPEHVDLALTQTRGALTLLGDGLRHQVAESALSTGERAVFLQRLGDARAALQGWAAWLTLEQARLAQARTAPERPASAPRVRSFRIGAELYEQKFRFELQSGFSAAELHARALAEKERLHTEMDAHTVALWPRYFAGRSMPADRLDRIGQMVAHLSQRHVRREQFVDEIKRQIPLLAAFVRERDLLDQDQTRPLVVRETPPYQRGGGAIASISAPGPFNPTADTYYNVTPLSDFSEREAAGLLREYNHWVLQILNIHEAIPGHYTQLMHSNKGASLVKALVRNGAMTEGWAVYAERMMLEQGWGGNEPEMWLMHGKWNLRVVTNAILDYAVHVQGMTEEQAMALLQREAFQESAEAANKWRRVRLSQVQLSSYFAGYADILALRERERARLGADFKLKDFHNRFLSHGSAPVPAIAELMLAR